MTSSGSTAVTAVELSPSVQLLSTTSNPSSASSTPWMVTSYPMMVLQQGIPQSLFAQSVLAFPEGHVVLAPVDESTAGQQVTTDVGSGVVQLSKTAKPRDQWLPSAASSTSSAGHSVKGTPEARGGAKQDGAGTAGMTQQVRNGSVQVLVPPSGSQQVPTARAELPAQPKKPLTPYMLFSKSIWPHVKAANSHLSSVCEIGAIVGSLWRDMDPKEKQRYNDLFARDKERYENELRTYLKTTGLNASDLAKQPKPKRIRDKPPTSWPSFSSTSSAPQGGTQAAAVAASNAAVQQDGQQAPADILPTFSQAWTGQVTPQLAAQQVLTQLGLSGQTLFANSDGSISVGGNNISSLLSLPSQSLQLVSVTGEPVATLYSETGQSGMSQIGVVTTSSDTPAGLDGTRPSWVWQQQPPALSVMAGQDGADGGAGASMVLYHLPASADSLGKVVELKNQLDQTNPGGSGGGGGDSSSVRSVIPSAQQYSVEQLGQLVGDGTNGGPSREAKLEAELHQMSCALMEKAQEVSDLTDKLRQAYELIERYKELSGESVADAPKSDVTTDPSSSQDAGNCMDESAGDAANQTSVAEN